MEMKLNSDWDTFAQLLDCSIDLKYFKKTFEIILPNLIKSKLDYALKFCSEDVRSE